MKRVLILAVILLTSIVGASAQSNNANPFYPNFTVGTAPNTSCNNGDLFYNVNSYLWFNCGPANTWNPLGGGGSDPCSAAITELPSGLHCVTLVFSKAQLLASDRTPLIVVPSPGANNVIFPVASRAKLTFVSQAYSNCTGGPYLWWENNLNAIGPVTYSAANGSAFSYNLIILDGNTAAMYASGLSAALSNGFDPALYTNVPMVLQPGSITETLNCGPLVSEIILAPGTGYHAGDLVSTEATNYGNRDNGTFFEVTSVNGSGGITGLEVSCSGTDIAGLASVLPDGNITASTLNSGGMSYAPGDTGTISGAGDGSAQYTILTVSGGGAVLTYSIGPNQGNGYVPATNISTSTGGSQPGSGTGFTINVQSGGGTGAQLNLTVLTGDGTLTLTLWYTIAPA
jgi:hypothetical protein